MTRSSSFPRLVLVAALAAIGCVAGSCAVTSTAACTSDADCLEGALCKEGYCAGGDVPTADFAAPETSPLDGLVTLDATASVTALGSHDGLTYRWSILAPLGVSFLSNTGAIATFKTAKPHAVYRIELVVADHGTRSAAVTREVLVLNTPPIPRITATPPNWPRNTTIQLTALGAGNSSSDPDGDTLTYAWSFTKEPETVAGALIPGVGGKATFSTGPHKALYRVTLTVTDEPPSLGQAVSASTTLDGVLNNAPPFINPGPAQTVPHTCVLQDSGERTCTASAALSATVGDAEGTVVASSFAWRLKSAPSGTATTAVITPTRDGGLGAQVAFEGTGAAPFSGAYELEFSAKDNDGATGFGVVVVTIGNTAPEVSFGDPAPRTVPHFNLADTSQFGADFALQVTVSDADGDAVLLNHPPIATTLEGATTEGEPDAADPTKVAHRVRVAWANPQSLRQGELPLYAATAIASDINGGSTTAELPILIGNRTPIAPAFVDQESRGHFFGALSEGNGVPAGTPKGYSGKFEAAAVDEDGDVFTGTLQVTGGPPDTRLFVAEVPNPASFLLFSKEPGIIGATVEVTCRLVDPFDTAELGAKLTLGNRPPTITQWKDRISEGHQYGIPAGGAEKGYFESFPLDGVEITDPDGDLIERFSFVMGPGFENVAVSGGDGAATAPKPITLFAPDPRFVENDLVVTALASDAFSEGSAAAKFRMKNRAPTPIGLSVVTPKSGTGIWGLSPSSVSCQTPINEFTKFGSNGRLKTDLSLTYSDPDGDPLAGPVGFEVVAPFQSNQLDFGTSVAADCAGVTCSSTVLYGFRSTNACGSREQGEFVRLGPHDITAFATDSVGARGARPFTIDVRF